MTRAPVQPHDPMIWCAAIAFAFWALLLWNLAIPSTDYFDEVHYLPAARQFLTLDRFTNREHPLFGKEMIALGIALFGDNPWGWRLLPSVAGTLTLFAGMRAMWFATCSQYATIAAGLLIASGFHLFVQSRIAMLDVFMLASFAVAYWQLAAAIREPENGRWRLALAGVALGLSIGAKWNAVPVAVLPGLAFLVLRWKAGRRRLLLSRRGMPVSGITLVEAAFWLGVVPILVYAATYIPGFLFARDAIPDGLIAHHRFMLELQEQVKQPHPYQSTWQQWVLNTRAIWYLYEPVDGAQRGVVLLGNPLTMWFGLPALLWCAYRGIRYRTPAHGAAAILYAASLCLWIVAPKPIQFSYHYALPSLFLLAALALSLDDLQRAGWRKTANGILFLSLALFAIFFPILSALPLSDMRSFAFWVWLPGWR